MKLREKQRERGVERLFKLWGNEEQGIGGFLNEEKNLNFRLNKLDLQLRAGLVCLDHGQPRFEEGNSSKHYSEHLLCHI